MNCRRCKREVVTDGVQVDRHIPPPDGRTYYLDGDTLGTSAIYHLRCLPPNLFHKFAGSLPVGQSPAGASLRNEHVAGGGLSHRKRRKRLARRVRYKRTEQRRANEQAQREAAQHQRTISLTIHDALNGGGKPRLCHCRVFNKDGYFVTEHGYCRYCGSWTPEVFRAACGEDALQAAISELDLHYRTEMQKLTTA